MRFLAVLSILVTSPAFAQQCAPRSAVIEVLHQFGETRLGSDLQGVSCVLAHGVGFETMRETLPPAGVEN